MPHMGLEGSVRAIRKRRTVLALPSSIAHIPTSLCQD